MKSLIQIYCEFILNNFIDLSENFSNMIDNSLTEINESEIRDALIEYTNKHSCMRLKPLKNLKIAAIHINKIYN
jgi:hypothetical protein